MTDIKQQVGNVIREARKAKGMTQKELADALNIQKAAISGYETGKQNLTIETLKNVSDALGVPLTIKLG